MLGTPSDAYLSTLTTDAQTYVRGFPHRQAIAWDQIFPDNVFPPSDRDFCSASNGRSLLSRMLVFDPEQRISIEDALKHLYVAWKPGSRDIDSQPRGVYAEEIEQRQLTTDQLKRKIYSIQ
uniref:Uncharacterized protein n=1 Tax=Acrobeloides nanus TaxID=290746 RepID=A0A914CI01_9BILA